MERTLTVTLQAFGNGETLLTQQVVAIGGEWAEQSRVTLPIDFKIPVDQIRFVRVVLTERSGTQIQIGHIALWKDREINLGWNFDCTIRLNCNDGGVVEFRGEAQRIDTTGGRIPASRSVDLAKKNA